MFKGSMPALVTPFHSNGSFDKKAFVEIVKWQIAEGSHGLVPVGTTGESPTLSHEEHMEVVAVCIEAAAGNVPVIAGAGSNNTTEAVDLAVHAEKAGATAVLVVSPYYNKPNQRGLKAHFAAVADAVSIPVILYNIPGRSIVDISIDTMAELFKEKSNVIGVKDATANLGRASEEKNALGDDWLQLSGEDITALGYNAHGGSGCISVTANVAPRLCSQFQEATLSGDFGRALEIQKKLVPLHKALFMEPSPGGAKYALSLLGRCNNVQRLPLVPISAETETAVKAAMVHAGLLN
ncbi:MAG: 4-hydroxy-tetrahydrodipicolinate synthase [Pseudomonadota bacterium]